MGRPSNKEMAKLLVTLYRFLPNAVSKGYGLHRQAQSMTLRNLGSVGGIFEEKEHADESIWIKRHEKEELERQRLVQSLSGTGRPLTLKKPSRVHKAESIANSELQAILRETRHIAPEHVQQAIIQWKIGSEKIKFSENNQDVPEANDNLYDNEVCSISSSPSQKKATLKVNEQYEYDASNSKVDKRRKDYKQAKKKIVENVAKSE